MSDFTLKKKGKYKYRKYRGVIISRVKKGKPKQMLLLSGKWQVNGKLKEADVRVVTQQFLLSDTGRYFLNQLSEESKMQKLTAAERALLLIGLD